MRPRPLAWLMTVVSLVMIVVLLMRVNRGWPAGPKTYAFIAATLVVIVATVMAWRRAAADHRTIGPAN